MSDPFDVLDEDQVDEQSYAPPAVTPAPVEADPFDALDQQSEADPFDALDQQHMVPGPVQVAPIDPARQYASDRLAQVRANRAARGLPPLPMVGDGSGPINEADLLNKFVQTYNAGTGRPVVDTAQADPLALAAQDPELGTARKAGMEAAGNLVAGFQGALGTVAPPGPDQELQDQSSALRELSGDIGANTNKVASFVASSVPWLLSPLSAAASVGGNRSSDIQDLGGSAVTGAVAGAAEGALSLALPKLIAAGFTKAQVAQWLTQRFGGQVAAQLAGKLLASTAENAAAGAGLGAASAGVSAATGDTERAKNELASIPEQALGMAVAGHAVHGIDAAVGATGRAIERARIDRALEPVNMPAPAAPTEMATPDISGGPEMNIQQALDMRGAQRPGVDPATIRSQQEIDATNKAQAQGLLAQQQRESANQAARQDEADAAAAADALRGAVRSQADAKQQEAASKAAYAEQERIRDREAAVTLEREQAAADQAAQTARDQQAAQDLRAEQTKGRDEFAAQQLEIEPQLAAERAAHEQSRTEDMDRLQVLQRRRGSILGQSMEEGAKQRKLAEIDAETGPIHARLAKPAPDFSVPTAPEHLTASIDETPPPKPVTPDPEGVKRGVLSIQERAQRIANSPRPVKALNDIAPVGHPDRPALIEAVRAIRKPAEQAKPFKAPEPKPLQDPEGVKRGPIPLTANDLAALPHQDRMAYLRSAPIGERPHLREIHRAIGELKTKPNPELMARARARFDDWRAANPETAPRSVEPSAAQSVTSRSHPGEKSVTGVSPADTKIPASSPSKAAPKGQAGVETPTPRLTADAFRRHIADLPISKRTPGLSDALMGLVDARARAVGKSTDQWIGDRVGGVKDQRGEPSLNQDALDQGDTLNDARVVRRGAVEFVKDGRAIIHAFEQADASTALHELGHVFRRDLGADEEAIAARWAGAKLVDGAWKWSVPAEEKFTRGFERYVREGHTPVESLKPIFQKFKSWLREIYKVIDKRSPINVAITPEIRGVFDRLFADGQESAPVSREATNAAPKPPDAPGAVRDRVSTPGPKVLPDQVHGAASVPADGDAVESGSKNSKNDSPAPEKSDTPLGTKNNRPDLATPGEDAATRKAFVRERNKMADPEHQNREEVRQRAKDEVARDPEAAFNRLTALHTQGQALNVDQLAQAQHLLEHLRKEKRTADFQRMATIYQVAGTEGARALGYRADLMQSPEGRLAEARSLAALPRPARAKKVDAIRQQINVLNQQHDILFQKDPDTARKLLGRIGALQKRLEMLKAQDAKVYERDKAHLKELGFDLDGDTSQWAYDRNAWAAFQGALDATRGGMPAAAREIYTGMLHMSGLVAGKKIVADTIGIPFGVVRRHIEAAVAGSKRAFGQGSADQASAGELAAMWTAMGPALARAARDGWETFKTEQIPKELMGDEDLMHYPALRGVKGKVFRHVALFGAVRSIDSFSRSFVANLEAHAQAYRSAVGADGKRLTDEALADHLHQELNDYASEAWEKAREAAMRATFTERPPEIVRTINRLKYDKASTPTRKAVKLITNVMLPFSTIPTNIAKQGLTEWTPGLSEALIMARAMHRRASTGEWGYDPNKFNRHTAQAVIRWSTALAMMGLAKSGVLTGSEDDKNPNSVNILGHHFSYANLGPIARVIGAAADWAESVKPSKGEPHPETAKAKAERTLHGAWDQFGEMPLIRAGADLTRAAQYDDGWRRFAADKAVSLVEPSIAHQALTAGQDEIRAKQKVKGDGMDRFLGYLKDRVTTNSGKPVKVDGRPLVKDRFDSDVGTFAWRLFSPFTLGTKDAGAK